MTDALVVQDKHQSMKDQDKGGTRFRRVFQAML